jgi:chromosome segregation ATPase
VAGESRNGDPGQARTSWAASRLEEEKKELEAIILQQKHQQQRARDLLQQELKQTKQDLQAAKTDLKISQGQILEERTSATQLSARVEVLTEERLDKSQEMLSQLLGLRDLVTSMQHLKPDRVVLHDAETQTRAVTKAVAKKKPKTSENLGNVSPGMACTEVSSVA